MTQDKPTRRDRPALPIKLPQHDDAAQDQQDSAFDEAVAQHRAQRAQAREQAGQNFRAWRKEKIDAARRVFSDSWQAKARTQHAREEADRAAASRTLALYDGQFAHEAGAESSTTQRPGPASTPEQGRLWLKDMRSGLRDADRRFMDSLRDSDIVVPGYDKQPKAKELDALRTVHTRMMAQMCLAPLKQGVNARSVVQAATTMTALMVLSPEIRSEVKDKATAVRDAIRDRSEAKLLEARKHAQWKLGAGQGSNKLDGQVGERYQDYLPERVNRRLELIERRERGNRPLYTAHTAAMTEVGLMDSAYWRMREPGADVQQIKDSHEAMQQLLHEQMMTDGVSREDVNERVQLIIGQRLKVEPEMRTMFEGLSHGRIQRGEERTVTVPGTEHTVRAWTGGFKNHLGQDLPGDASFTVRRPQNDAEHQVHMATTMKQSIKSSLLRGDPHQLQTDLYCYPVGFAAAQNELDTDALPASVRQRIEQAQTMIATMSADGLDQDMQQEVFSNAYVDAVNEVMTEVPDFQQRLEATLGHDWDTALGRMQQAASDPDRFLSSMQQMTRTQRSQQARTRAEEQWYAQPEAQPQGG